MPYGFEVPNHGHGPRGVIGTPERSPAGNLVLRVGQDNLGQRGWRQTEHVVLTPDEARDFLAACERTLAP